MYAICVNVEAFLNFNLSQFTFNKTSNKITIGFVVKFNKLIFRCLYKSQEPSYSKHIKKKNEERLAFSENIVSYTARLVRTCIIS